MKWHLPGIKTLDTSNTDQEDIGEYTAWAHVVRQEFHASEGGSQYANYTTLLLTPILITVQV